MVGLDASIIMHPQVWKCSGHYDLFHDMMVDCRETKHRYRFDQVRGRWAEYQRHKVFVTAIARTKSKILKQRRSEFMLRSKMRAKESDKIALAGCDDHDRSRMVDERVTHEQSACAEATSLAR